MKKEFETPKLESVEFVVAARLSLSSVGGAIGHSQPEFGCTLKANASPTACVEPSVSNSGNAPKNCSK